MNLITSGKRRLMLLAFAYKKRKNQYDESASERHKLPAGSAHIENDSHFFNANSVSVGATLSARLGSRSGGRSEVFVLYKVADKFYVQESDVYSNESTPLMVSLIESGRKWLYEFDGTVIDTADGSHHALRFSAVFCATRPIYDYFYHCHRFDGMANAIAAQKWSVGYFKRLGELNQRHYEQTGIMEIKLKLDGIESALEMPSTRDHSFGVREWSFMDDHIWFSCQNSAGNAFCFSVVNYPLMKRVYSGYTDLGADGANHSLSTYSIRGYSHNDGVGADNLEIECVMDDGRHYQITMHRDSNTQVYFDGGDYMFQEGLATFLINGDVFRGTIEYGFNKDKNRWEDYK